MKITTFNPLIVSSHADELMKLFEELGFERRHAPTVDVGTMDVTCVRMKDTNGNAVDVAQVDGRPQDLTIIRMNVDNFDEVYAILKEHGFKNTRDDQTIDTATNKSAMMVSPSGFAFDLVQHINNN